MSAPFRSYSIPTAVLQWWLGKPPHDRRILALVTGIAVVGVLWAVAWQPLTRDVAAMRAGHTQRIATMAEAQRRAEEMAGLARTVAAVVPSDDRAALERVLVQHGLRGAVTELGWQEGRAHIVFGAVGFDALANLLEALQRDAHLRLIEGTLTARVEAGTVRAELTLSR